MNLSEEQLSEIEEMAGLFFSPEDVSLNLGLNEEETESFVSAIECKNTKNPFVAAYMRGRLITEIELRKSIKQSASNGSNPAQQMMLNFQKESRK